MGGAFETEGVAIASNVVGYRLMEMAGRPTADQTWRANSKNVAENNCSRFDHTQPLCANMAGAQMLMMLVLIMKMMMMMKNTMMMIYDV